MRKGKIKNVIGINFFYFFGRLIGADQGVIIFMVL